METKKSIIERRSVRSFTDQEIEKEKLEEILTAGIWAATAGNAQPWTFICVTDKNVIRNIKVMSPGMLAQPSAIICILSNYSYAVERMGPQGSVLAMMDCSMAAQNMMLRAHDLGLGSCVIRSFNQNAVRELLSAPESHTPELLLMAGYPASTPPPPPRNRSILFWNKFDGDTVG